MNKRILKGVIGASVVSAAMIIAAADCGGIDPDPNVCDPATAATDCPEDGELCHPALLECVQNCVTDDTACPVDAPTCNEEAADGTRPLDEGGFENLCVCVDDTDCGAGEICDPTEFRCVEGDAPACEVDGDCTDEALPFCVEGACVACNVDDDCGEFESCTDNACVGIACDLIDDGQCTDVEALCDGTNCADPDLVTGDCTGANSFDTARVANGPLVYDVDFERDPDLDVNCEGLNGDAYAIFVAAHDNDDDIPDVESNTQFTWAEDGSAVQFASASPVWTDGGAEEGTVLATVCFVTPPETIAIQIEDDAGNVSNVFCEGLAP